jgi:hypothetical protein
LRRQREKIFKRETVDDEKIFFCKSATSFKHLRLLYMPIDANHAQVSVSGITTDNGPSAKTPVAFSGRAQQNKQKRLLKTYKKQNNETGFFIHRYCTYDGCQRFRCKQE